ncbi:hypothetical protein NVP2275O_419 [Vibrio phage 2.275.O._10N.286.54.E11]|nr:hypothetical protein NVP2275O_419 [Vibrio phage 2.275.O._10N.286.54.E11]
MFRLGANNRNHNPDIELVDSLVEEQYTIGGVDMWVYRYLGPKGTPGSTDATKPDFMDGSEIDDIGNLVWGENAQRDYDVNAVTLPMSYQQQDSTLQMQIPGLFLWETMDVTIPYRMMIKRCGRKIMNGDVIEMPHYRDDEILNSDDVLNRFYTVHNAHFAAEGYSMMYSRHIWKLQLVPLTDSPEFSDLLGDPNDEDSLGNLIGSNEKELAIMDSIIGQADAEVPYIHWDSEQIFTNVDETGETSIRGTHDNQREGLPPTEYTEVTEFPSDPINGEWVLRTDFKVPLFFQYESELSIWRQFEYKGRQPWTGPDLEASDLLNNTNTYTDSDGTVKPSRQSIRDVIKPGLDDI